RKDDVLTALIHLGYLAFDETTEMVYLPNKEVRMCFEDTIEDTGWDNVIRAIEQSERLLHATIAGDEEEVAEQIDICHRENTSILNYHDENSLASCITLAYYTARNDYQIIREMPAGYGFADMVFLPLPGRDKPAMVVELKWNKKCETALDQIREKKYIEALKGYKGEVILVGISYEKRSENKEHVCKIDRVVLEN
ncbi:MAG: PD-(D/E)XK nuclease domain-containing protein, partial [Lachnospiraceae bacterium]|nr:PD-(D/E)XK nuclease domain-containing protein [Lachnospiraceae bacterium]